MNRTMPSLLDEYRLAVTTSIGLSLEGRKLVILGTEYAGEMMKGVFTVANYFAPKRDVLAMHCSATTAGKATGTSSLLRQVRVPRSRRPAEKHELGQFLA